MIEHYQAAFPLWLSPVQAKVLAISDRHHEYANQVASMLHKAFVRVEVDQRVESLSKKIAEAQEEKVPYIVVIGDKEVQNQLLSVRQRGSAGLKSESLNNLLEELQRKIAERCL